MKYISLVCLCLLFLWAPVNAQDLDQYTTHQGFHSYACIFPTLNDNQLELIDFDSASPLTADKWLYNASGDYVLSNPNSFAVPFREFFSMYVGGNGFPTYTLYSVTKQLQIEPNSVGQQFNYHGITTYDGSTFPGPYGIEWFAVYVLVPDHINGVPVRPLGCQRIEDFTTENNCNSNFIGGGC